MLHGICDAGLVKKGSIHHRYHRDKKFTSRNVTMAGFTGVKIWLFELMSFPMD